MKSHQSINGYLRDIRAELVDFLSRLIQFKSIRGNEQEAQEFLRERFAPLVDTAELIAIPEDIVNDPDYAFFEEGLSYKNRPDLLLRINGSGEGKSLIINTHVDVVPAPEGYESIFAPQAKDGKIFGRGACDCKGQIAILYALLKSIREFGLHFKGDILFHLVIEEEVGGNGTLHLVNQNPCADGVIILEPSSLDVHPSVRGAVWFEIRCEGQAGHSGSEIMPVSAVKVGVEVMNILEQYHRELLSKSGGIRYFEQYANPMPLTFGMFHGGNWPSSVPREAVLKGLLGFLPNKDRKTIQKEIRERIMNCGNEWIRDHVSIRYSMLNNDACALPEDHPLLSGFVRACEENDHIPVIRGMTASCDAWMYGTKLGIPTIVFGAGDLASAHSATENVAVDDILKAARILFSFIKDWCGTE